MVAYFDPAADGTVNNVRIGVIGAGPTPCRIKAAEQALDGHPITDDNIKAACTLARDAVDPPEDIHASPAYRRALTATLLERCLRHAAKI